MAEKDIKVINVVKGIQAPMIIGADGFIQEVPSKVGKTDFYQAVRDATLPNHEELKTRL